jgi:hypothetical protein
MDHCAHGPEGNNDSDGYSNLYIEKDYCGNLRSLGNHGKAGKEHSGISPARVRQTPPLTTVMITLSMKRTADRLRK